MGFRLLRKKPLLQLGALTRRYGWYVVLALVVVWPLLGPGFILTLDMVFTPKLAMPTEMSNSYLFYTLLHWLNYILPADVIQKVILLAILLLSGIGMHRLVLHLKIPQTLPRLLPWAAYFAGSLFMMNPFMYSRFMAGQYAVLLGFTLLPWTLHSLLSLLHSPTLWQTVRFSGWIVLGSIVSIHGFGLVALLTVSVVLVHVWQHRRNKSRIVTVLKHSVLAAGLVGLLSAYWLVPTLLGQGRIAQSLTNFDSVQRQAFATVDTNGDGALLAVLGLQGFWADSRDLYLLPGAVAIGWGVVQLFLWALVLVGVVVAWRRQRWTALYFSVIALLSIMLAMGWLNEWLVGIVPFFAGYREPQKFVALLVLAYAYFGAVGFAALLQRYTQTTRRLSAQIRTAGLLLCLLALPLLYTPTMLWGMYGQLQPRHYPADWYQVNNLLNADTGDQKVLFLPWHLYMSFGFAGRIIANPADSFFDKSVVVSDDPEFNGARPQIDDPPKRQISQQLLPMIQGGQPISSHLRQLGIKYIIVAKELDYQDYAALGSLPDMQVIANTDTLLLYRLKEGTHANN